MNSKIKQSDANQAARKLCRSYSSSAPSRSQLTLVKGRQYKQCSLINHLQNRHKGFDNSVKEMANQEC